MDTGSNSQQPPLRAEATVYDPSRHDPALIVVFIAAPGFRKTEICNALTSRLDLGKFHVVHRTGGTPAGCKAGRYWSLVNGLAATERHDGRMTVVLADRNFVIPGDQSAYSSDHSSIHHARRIPVPCQ